MEVLFIAGTMASKLLPGVGTLAEEALRARSPNGANKVHSMASGGGVSFFFLVFIYCKRKKARKQGKGREGGREPKAGSALSGLKRTNHEIVT